MSKAMARQEWDELYHLLRRACVGCDGEDKLALRGLSSHLLGEGGDYMGLLKFLERYGNKFLTEEIWGIIASYRPNIRPKRIVEVGAGYGWLGRFLASRYGVPLWSIDKRHWPGIDLILDVETISGLYSLTKILTEDDLVVCSEFLHCLEDPHIFLNAIRHNYALVVEYATLPRSLGVRDYRHSESYTEQISRYGANPEACEALVEEITAGRCHQYSTHPYDLYILEPIPRGGA